MKDSAWVQKILSGDRMAGERFVNEHYPRIYRLLRHLTGDVETAEDLTQQTFVKAWKSLASFQNKSLLLTWLHRIAYHEYIHWLRDRKRHSSLDLFHNLPAPQTEPEWEALDLPGALAQLTPELRVTFLLYYVQELSVAEVASALELPQGTIKSRLSTARLRLRELLQETLARNDRSHETAEPRVPNRAKRERLNERLETPTSWSAKEVLSDDLPATQSRQQSS
jgi:RNA polymerase sigma-70 factor (ECF subfamily)